MTKDGKNLHKIIGKVQKKKMKEDKIKIKAVNLQHEIISK